MYILLVNPHDEMLRLLEIFLLRSGHDVIAIHSSEVAVEALKHDRTIEMVIAAMISCDGSQILQQARLLKHPARIWISSGSMDYRMEQEALSLGAEKAVCSLDLIQTLKNKEIIVLK